jgi:signal transduction histidine kinase
MKRSFKLQIFIRLFFVTGAIIGANRLIAQSFLTDQLRDRITHEMGEALASCTAEFDDRTKFLTCFKDKYRGGLISNVSDFYVLCQRGQPARGLSSLEQCPTSSAEPFRPTSPTLVVDRIELSRGSFNTPVLWYAARFEGQVDGPEIWLRQSDADKMVDQMWELRDRNLVRVLPVVVVMLMLMTIYMTRVIFQPISSIEENMRRLNTSNLDQSAPVRAPYREFEKLVDVFEGLRIRLNDGFIKARRFASDASHELRTPLTILRGQTEQLLHEVPVGSDMQIRMRSMSDEVERLIDITEKLLLLSRADANSLLQKLTDVNFSELVIRFVRDAQSFQTNLKVTWDVEPDIIWHCDQTLVHQMIQNLYTNAVNYNRVGGWIHLSLKTFDGSLCLTIENSTSDVPIDLAERAFDRFYRGDASHTRQQDGLGLGLSICSEIAHLHQATLTLAASAQQTIVVRLVAPHIFLILNSSNSADLSD